MCRSGVCFIDALMHDPPSPDSGPVEPKAAAARPSSTSSAVTPAGGGIGKAVTARLERSPAPAFAAYAIAAAFATYFCMYAFRKPFAVARFDGDVMLFGLVPVGYKILLIVSQVIGYCSSKFIGIKVVSEMGGARRALAICACIGLAEFALLLFAIVPAPYDALCMMLNGLPLGMVWGLVFGFLEGRKLSELLGAGLSASYIVASGAVKAVGKLMLNEGVSEKWMPVLTGLLFAVPLLIAVWLLSRLPPPSAEDEAARTKRVPMDGHARRAFVARYAPGLISLTGLYMLLTAYRDFRDNFAREIWDALGYGGEAGVFATAEIPIAFGVLLVLAGIMVIKDNRRAFVIIHLIMLSGSVLIALSTLLFQLGVLSGGWWMVLVGLGLYIGYVPYGCVLFDRLIATVGVMATAGFMIYVTDAFGYLGSVGLLLYKNFGQASLSWLEFFIRFSYGTGIVCTLCFSFSLVYFSRTVKEGAARTTPTTANEEPGA